MEHETEAGRMFKLLIYAQTLALQHSTTQMAAAYETYIRGSSGSASTESRFSLISDGEGPPNGGVQRALGPAASLQVIASFLRESLLFG